MAVILVGGLGWLLDILLKKKPSKDHLSQAWFHVIRQISQAAVEALQYKS
jgi:hypothetical protein